MVNVKKKYLILLCFLSVLLKAPVAFSAALLSHVNQQQITPGSTIQLTVQYDAETTDEPNFEILNDQFEIIGQSVSRTYQMINGISKTGVRWTLSLMPRHDAQKPLVIPALSLGQASSKPIHLAYQAVQSMNNAQKMAQAKLFFCTAEIDKSTVSVQEQVLYTERLYTSLSLTNYRWPAVVLEDMLVLPELPEDQTPQGYAQTINGRTYRVFERRYAIFPQKSGRFTLPGTQCVGRHQRGFFQFKEYADRSESIALTVLTKPEQYPQQAAWIPARSLSISLVHPIAQQQTVGQAIDLQIQVQVVGLSGAQLPEIELPEMDGLKYYLEAPTVSEAFNEDGLHTVQTTDIAVIPTKTGQYSIPSVRMAWWNTEHHRLETAYLNFQSFQVNPGQAAVVGFSSQDDGLNDMSSATPTMPDLSPFWKYFGIISVILNIALLCAAYLLWRRSQKAGSVQSKHTAAPESVHFKTLKQQLRQACQQSELSQARKALLAWCAYRWADGNMLILLETLEGQPDIHSAVLALDQSLFGHLSLESRSWDGQHFWKIIEPVITKRPQQTDSTHRVVDSFQSLYSDRV